MATNTIDKIKWAAEEKGEEAISLNTTIRTEECARHENSELLSCTRAILLCKSHHPVWSFNNIADEELCFHVVRVISLTSIK